MSAIASKAMKHLLENAENNIDSLIVGKALR
jgi:Mrp family chromosome partitioning ATPase